MKRTCALIALFISFALIAGCTQLQEQQEPSNTSHNQSVIGNPNTGQNSTDQAGTGLSLIKKIELDGAARPEIVADLSKNRIWVVYLSPSATAGNSFRVKIYDYDLNSEIASKAIVANSSEYGSPTDIRAVSDDNYIYVFYEVAGSSRSYLFGEKYTKDDKFEKVASTGVISSSAMFKLAKNGDEKLDDPAPMLAGDSVYVMTRYKYTLAQEGQTIYRLYEFDKNLSRVSDFALNLSDYADGGAGQSSIIYENGYYYLAMQTITGASTMPTNLALIWATPADVIVLKLDKDFKVVEKKTIASDPGYTDAYVTGLKSDGKYFYVTYNKVSVSLGKGFSSVIGVFDKGWNPVFSDAYKSAQGGAGGGLRPSIEATSDRIYAGNDAEGVIVGDVYVFEKP